MGTEGLATGALSVPRTVWAPKFSSKQEAVDAQALSVLRPKAGCPGAELL